LTPDSIFYENNEWLRKSYLKMFSFL
jgi:hypothetical protein